MRNKSALTLGGFAAAETGLIGLWPGGKRRGFPPLAVALVHHHRFPDIHFTEFPAGKFLSQILSAPSSIAMMGVALLGGFR